MPFDTPTRQPGPSFFTVAREIVAHQEARREAHPKTGVCWSAMTSPAPEVESVEVVAARLEAEAERAAQFRATPEGRFHAAAWAILKATGDERLMGCVNRGLSEIEIARAARILSAMSGPAADQARDALADVVARA